MPADEARLSQIATRWSLLMRAHQSDAHARQTAQTELLTRYCGAAYRYLCSLVRDDAAAEELCQEFALRLIRGDFRHADPNRGRFRDYLKTSLVHLAGESARRNNRAQMSNLALSVAAEVAPDAANDREFIELWRSELLDRTWAALEAESRTRADVLCAVLRLKCDAPDRTSADLAGVFSERIGRAVTADGFRQSLHRARIRFAELLRAEVAASIPSDEPEIIDGELAELGLLVYCQPN